ncbi:hypothetical protein SAMD00023353_6000730 [Rosellinia necatrix]|uniref:Uncharacterized protein n=1 Tax=Rosellinia necatrix TaxID=77044 RepID=A0A1S8AAM0_ROSNE|nr:hypothetical protein SAMD00023353_6000730 [Rosellinia necatrix]
MAHNERIVPNSAAMAGEVRKVAALQRRKNPLNAGLLQAAGHHLAITRLQQRVFVLRHAGGDLAMPVSPRPPAW